jgi:hypothetical protein
MPWKLTVRRGPKVERTRFAELDAALDMAERRVQELAAGSADSSVNAGYRRFAPAEVVAARVELSGPQRLLPSAHAGVDIRGDGSTEAYTGRVRKAHVETCADESISQALRRVLSRERL